MRNDLTGKRVLLIGSGADLNGRGLNERISAMECEWDCIARINKHYGAIADVGRRMDICFVGHREWATWYFGTATRHEPHMIVAFRDGCGCDTNYRDKVAREINLGERVSSGLAAVHWLLAHGAQVDIIGFNAPGGEIDASGVKTYATGEIDANKKFDWTAEILWIKGQPGVTLL